MVEDDAITAKALATILTNQNYAVELAMDGNVAAELIDAFTYDLLLLDVVLPGLDGVSLCRQLRAQGQTVPILLLTGRDSSHDKAVGLDAGADDYVVKPCDPEELVARVRALLRRGEGIASPILTWERLTLDPSTCEVTYTDRPLPLTPKEYGLLELLMRNHRRVFSCGMILEHLWSYEDAPGEEAVRTHVKGLRQKLKAVGAPADFIDTVYGIGYRLKPLSTTPGPQAAGKTSPPLPVSTQAQTLKAIAEVWHRFKPRLQEQLSVIEAAIATLSHPCEHDRSVQQQAITEAHTLAGSLGTFGVAEGSRLAREIEHKLQSSAPLSTEEMGQLQQQFQGLRQAIQNRSDPDSPDIAVASPLAPTLARNGCPQILMVDRDLSLITALTAEADLWGFHLRAVPTLSAAQSLLRQKTPQVILFDPATVPDPQARHQFLSQLTQQRPPIPVLVLSTEKSLSLRLDTLRWGGQAFLEKPLAPTLVLDAINQVLHRSDRTEAKVLIVDDDPQSLETYKHLLEPWGLNVSTLADPRQFWQTLETTRPEILILDVKMPHIDGVELCRVVRNDPYWAGLPVIVLTAHTGAAVINQVFAAGADDFVSKPIIGPELINRILNRLERTKLQQRLADTDLLTGVMNRHKSIRELELRLRAASEQDQAFCLAVLEIDQFKHINHHYGYGMGDRVLRQVGQSLQQACSSHDLVARWSGDEFVVGLEGISHQEGVTQLNQVLKTLSVHNMATPEQASLSFTVSVGVAAFPEDGSTLPALYQRANEALAHAKAKLTQ